MLTFLLFHKTGVEPLITIYGGYPANDEAVDMIRPKNEISTFTTSIAFDLFNHQARTAVLG